MDNQHMAVPLKKNVGGRRDPKYKYQKTECLTHHRRLPEEKIRGQRNSRTEQMKTIYTGYITLRYNYRRRKYYLLKTMARKDKPHEMKISLSLTTHIPPKGLRKLARSFTNYLLPL